jgi:hypothetical protein
MTNTHQYPSIEIKHRWTNDVLFSSAKAKSLRDAVIEAVASGANLSYANLSDANLSDSNLISANLYGADLNGSKIVSVAQIAFTGHEEFGRTLIAIQTETAIYIRCGCFAGSPDELRAWITGDEKRLAKTRTLALDTALILLAAKNDEVGE